MDIKDSNLKDTQEVVQMNIYNQENSINHQNSIINLGVESTENINMTKAPLPISYYNKRLDRKYDYFQNNINNDYPMTDYRNQIHKKDYNLPIQNYVYPDNNRNIMGPMQNVPIYQNKQLNYQTYNNNNNHISNEKPKKKCSKKCCIISTIIFIVVVIIFVVVISQIHN